MAFHTYMGYACGKEYRLYKESVTNRPPGIENDGKNLESNGGDLPLSGRVALNSVSSSLDSSEEVLGERMPD